MIQALSPLIIISILTIIVVLIVCLSKTSVNNNNITNIKDVMLKSNIKNTSDLKLDVYIYKNNTGLIQDFVHIYMPNAVLLYIKNDIDIDTIITKIKKETGIFIGTNIHIDYIKSILKLLPPEEATIYNYQGHPIFFINFYENNENFDVKELKVENTHLFNYSTKFPRLIHQIYLGFSGPISEKWQDNHNTWIDMHPTYEHILWNMDDCQKLLEKPENKFFQQIFNDYKYDIQRADAIRYFILREYGGVYCDLDVIPNYDITALLEMYEQNYNLEVLLCESQTGHHESNWFMISRPNAIFWTKVIEVMTERSKDHKLTKHFTVLSTTGPRLLKNICDSRDYNTVYKMPRSLINSCSSCNKKLCSKFSLLNDQHAASWNSDSSKFNTLYCSIEPVTNLTWQSWILFIVIIVLLFIVLCSILYYLWFKCRKNCKKSCDLIK